MASHPSASALAAAAFVVALAAGCGQPGKGAPKPAGAADSPAAPARAASTLEPGETRQEQAAAAAQALGGRLKARLMATLQGEGAVAAIGVCSIEAPAIAAAVSAQSGLSVGRTSLKVRNPANAPDPRERAVLAGWEQAVAGGAAAEDLPVHVETGDDFLWMKPIVLEGPCLTCHGKDLAAPVASAIAERYPQDQATGYALGDLRGAFVVRAAEG